MKKSELYHLAQIAIVTSNCITPENKLKILRVLISDEDLALYREDQELSTNETSEQGGD